MSFQPDNRNERDVLPPRITTSNVTLDKEKSSIRSPQPADGLGVYDVQNFKKSSQSRPIAPASLSSLNSATPFIPRTFNAMYSQMPSVMMPTHGAVPYFPFPRHISALAVSATPAGVATPASVHGPPRPSLTAPGRPPVVAHHVKPSQPNPLHAMPGIPRPVHPTSTTLQQTRSPSPKLVQESAASELPKGDIKSQATPTEAHSVVESRPAMSEPASHSLHHKTSTTTTSKTALSSGISKNMLGLSTQPVIGAPTYVQHTTSTSPHLTSVSRTPIPGLSPVGPVSSVTSNFNIPKVISHGAITPGLGSLYPQHSPLPFAARPPQLQDHTRLLKPSSTTSSVSFGGHTGTLPATVVSAQTVGANARIDGNRQLPASFSGISQFFDSHTGTVSSLPPQFKPYVPIESVVRKPTSIAQVPSASHVTTGISSVQLMTTHNPAASVAVVNMGVPFTNSESINENPVIHNNSSHSNSTSIFSVQNMLSTTSSSTPNTPSSTNVTSLSPRPSILRKRQEITRKPINQPSFGDPVVLVRTNDISGSPRPDGTLSTSHSRQNSPKSESGTQNLEQLQKTLENGPSHPSILSPSKIKREFSSPSSTPSIPAVNTVSLSAVPPHDVGASPRKKPRKQNVIATEDKFSSLPMHVQEINEKKSVFIDKLDQEEDEELKFLMLKRRCVSIYGGYKVNNKAAHNHFQRYSDVKAKDEKKPSLQEIASERSVTQRATGWKIHHVAAQLDELKTCEEEVLLKMYEFRERLPKYKPDHKRYDEMVMLHELLQGNIQRSQLVIEQLSETKKTTVKILDHQKGIMDILKKNIKRHVKKKS